MAEDADLMRGYMRLAESLVLAELDEPAPEPAAMPESAPDRAEAILAELREIVSKLRSHTEHGANADEAVGVEIGMQRAADMIERVIGTHGV